MVGGGCHTGQCCTDLVNNKTLITLRTSKDYEFKFEDISYVAGNSFEIHIEICKMKYYLI